MKKTLKIEMEIWDNTNTTEEKQDILLYCEHVLLKAWSYYKNPHCEIKIIDRYWAGFTAIVTWDDWWLPATEFLRIYNRKLCRLHYWNRDDDSLIMKWDLQSIEG